MIRHVARKREDEVELISKIHELAIHHSRYGYCRITILLGREGWKVNRKRVHRIWKAEGLGLPLLRPRRRRIGPVSETVNKTEYPNHVWSYDSPEDRTERGGKMRINQARFRSLYEMLKGLIDKYNVKLISTAEIIEELIKLANKIKKAVEEGDKLGLMEEELAFYDLLSSKGKIFENFDQIHDVAKEIVAELGYYMKVADWNRKEYLKARIKTALKKVLIKTIDGRATYKEIEQLCREILDQAEVIYAAA